MSYFSPGPSLTTIIDFIKSKDERTSRQEAKTVASARPEDQDRKGQQQASNRGHLPLLSPQPISHLARGQAIHQLTRTVVPRTLQYSHQ